MGAPSAPISPPCSNGLPWSSILSLVYAGPNQAPTDNLYVKGLPQNIQQDGLLQIFTGLGCTVQRSKILKDTKNIDGTVAAMVQLASLAEASYCIQRLNGQTIEF